jgi:hypothetical protein
LTSGQRVQLHASCQRNINSTSVTVASTPTVTSALTSPTSLPENPSHSTMTAAPLLGTIFASHASPSANQEPFINESAPQNTICQVNSNRIIHVKSHDISVMNNWGLINGGASNGMACVEMREMYRNPHEFVDVIVATDGADLVNLPVGSHCAKIQAVGGQNVIGVFNNFAGYGKGKSVISKF